LATILAYIGAILLDILTAKIVFAADIKTETRRKGGQEEPKVSGVLPVSIVTKAVL